MSVLRGPALLALLVLLLTAGYCRQSAAPPEPRPRGGHALMELVMDRARLEQPAKKTDFSLQTKEGNDVNKSRHVIEVFPRDLRQKEKFLKHLTGPLYFNPKCRKHFYRLYHNTRDCTIPAYYKRCARLLTRLAGSQRCTER